MGNLGETDRMHDDQRRALLRADSGIPVVRKGAQIVQHMHAAPERRCGDFRTPRIDRDQGRKHLVGVPGFQTITKIGKPLEKWKEAAQLLLHGYCGTVCSPAFGADVDDVGALGDQLTAAIQGSVNFKPSFIGERIVIKVTVTHSQGSP